MSMKLQKRLVYVCFFIKVLVNLKQEGLGQNTVHCLGFMFKIIFHPTCYRPIVICLQCFKFVNLVSSLYSNNLSYIMLLETKVHVVLRRLQCKHGCMIINNLYIMQHYGITQSQHYDNDI